MQAQVIEFADGATEDNAARAARKLPCVPIDVQAFQDWSQLLVAGATLPLDERAPGPVDQSEMVCEAKEDSSVLCL